MEISGKVKFWSYLGCAIGMLGWLIGLTIFCLATGMTDLLSQVFLPGLLISLIMVGFFILILESVIHRFGFRHYTLQITLWALLLSVMGLMIFILNHWLAPLIEQHPELSRKLVEAGSVYRISDVVPIALMAAGSVLLTITTVAVLRGNKIKPEK